MTASPLLAQDAFCIAVPIWQQKLGVKGFKPSRQSNNMTILQSHNASMLWVL